MSGGKLFHYAKCPVAETSPGMRHNKVSTDCRLKNGMGGNSCNRDAQILKIKWCKHNSNKLHQTTSSGHTMFTAHFIVIVTH